ncbi:endonuclease [Vairimorpha necatrix]|uniref:Endonuclease n=1 Tax=Vairimorpha necatrix TaxID=6039 RepID=A0AAX4JEX3_9MICR
MKTEISSENILQELQRASLLSSFNKLSNEEKIDYFIHKANIEILDWHSKLMKEKRKCSLTFEMWKELAETEFDCGTGLYELYTLKQKENQSIVEFIKDVEKKCLKENIRNTDKRKIIRNGILSRYKAIKMVLTGQYEINKEFLEIIDEMEKENNDITKIRQPASNNINKRYSCYFCHKDGHIAKDCFAKKKITDGKQLQYKRINEIHQEGGMLDANFINNKEDLIYVYNEKINVTFDSGSYYNFISKKAASELTLKIYRSTEEIYFLTCLEERFGITEYVILDFSYGGKSYRSKFFIFPKVEKFKILVGKKTLQEILKRVSSNRICEINTIKGEKIVEKVYTLPKKLEEGVEKSIKELLRKNYIRKSKSTWLNNLRPVIKPDGSIRVTTNLVSLNKLVELDNYSLPHIDKLLYGLRGKKYFSKLDLKDAFFCIELAEKDRYKTAFRFKHLLYEWNVMPMGFKNAPAIFQRFIDDVLQEEIGKSCFVYVDDILVFGENEEEHDFNYEKIITKLKSYNLGINEDKTIYKVKELTFLGHLIAYNEIKPKITRDQAINDMKRPINKKSLQEFLGLINYYRKFISNCSKIGGCLYDLTKNDIQFNWGKEQDAAFNTLKKIVLSSSVLKQPDFSKPYILETDACDSGLGAILSQENEGHVYPIAYASRRLVPAERNYSISEKECLGVLWGMENFRYFLYGNEFKVITDHKALEVLNKGEIKSLRIQRWLDKLSEYNYTIEYKRGTDIPHVDCLSRSYLNELNTDEINMIEFSEEEKRSIIRNKHIELVHRGSKVIENELRKKYHWKDMSHMEKNLYL